MPPTSAANAYFQSIIPQKTDVRRYFRHNTLTMTAFATVIRPVALGDGVIFPKIASAAIL
jgi:hypothetical protein